MLVYQRVRDIGMVWVTFFTDLSTGCGVMTGCHAQAHYDLTIAACVAAKEALLNYRLDPIVMGAVPLINHE
jgi:hypothetical protein